MLSRGGKGSNSGAHSLPLATQGTGQTVGVWQEQGDSERLLPQSKGTGAETGPPPGGRKWVNLEQFPKEMASPSLDISLLLLRGESTVTSFSQHNLLSFPHLLVLPHPPFTGQ